MRAGARRGAVAAAVVLLTVASLAAITWQRLAGPAVAADGTATLHGLTTQIRQAEWVPLDHVHDGDGGFLMPDQMMPGAPAGDEVRLGITLTLSNTSSGTREFNLSEEFIVTGESVAAPAPLRADSIGGLPRLGPGTAVDGTLYFDVEVVGDDAALYLQWTRNGDMIRIALPFTDAPDHQHG